MTVATGAGTRLCAWRITVRGLIQGVGFRPFVSRLATRHGLHGWVRNESGAVVMHVEGRCDAVERFVVALPRESPPLAVVTCVERAATRRRGARRFHVAPSVRRPGVRQPVPPDAALCTECERELLDPASRRFRHPFITCTNCGPRFTGIAELPYDRVRTSMRVFHQCPACEREYHDPASRRYHCETNACPDCGPRVWLTGPVHERVEGIQAIRAAADLLRSGLIVAVRGMGGFHLAVDASSETAVRRLREHKGREAKPLAVMVASLDAARSLARMTPVEERELQSPQRPIVLVERRPGSALAPSVAAALRTVGLMTPSTPLHRLLLEHAGRPLVMTSGNRTGEPIAAGNEEALARLSGIADAFLLHDREIVIRMDDSVLRVVDAAPVFLRRARGCVPLPLALPVPSPVPLLAVGPHLKHTFTLAEGNQAFVSQHIGELDNVETLEHFRTCLAHFQALFRIQPTVVVRDRHPGYLSTRMAEGLGLDRVIAVQHHVAHVAAVLAEHGRAGPIIGVAYDGTGYGDDGHTWGAEVFVATLTDARRVAHLRPAPLPGGDRAARSPWRAALGFQALAEGAAPTFAAAFTGVPASELDLVRTQVRRGLNAPLASSMGRLFDAAAAVIGLRRESRFEGQAPMELEALAGATAATPLPFPIVDPSADVMVLDPLPLLAALDDLRARGEARASLAARFHESVAVATAALIGCVADRTGLRTVVLSGGVFQNARLLTATRRRLATAGLEVLVPRLLGPNDGAISYGQAAVGAATLAAEGT